MDCARSLDAFGDAHNYSLCHFVLDGEYVVETSVIPLGPNMRGRSCIDQLRSDPNAIADLADAAFDDVFNP